jgi:hypothetical protein
MNGLLDIHLAFVTKAAGKGGRVMQGKQIEPPPVQESRLASGAEVALDQSHSMMV